MSSVIGQRLPKLDAPDKATGRTVYGHDVQLPGMLHGGILYSRHPHARILSVDISRALRLPGAKTIITAADNPRVGANLAPAFFGYGKDNTPLKGDVVRSLRDEVAAVAAADADAAQEALDVEFHPIVFSTCTIFLINLCSRAVHWKKNEVEPGIQDLVGLFFIQQSDVRG